MSRPRYNRSVPRGIANLLIALYPALWRERYEDEFREVLCDCPLSFAIIADTCVAALDAHLHFGQATRQLLAIRRARARRATLVAILLLWGAPVAIGGSQSRPYRSLFG